MSVHGTQQVRKVCCKCEKDLHGQPREKDHEGNYWCKPCSQADKLHKLHVESGICEGCGEAVGNKQLIQLAGEALCPNCRERRFKFGIKSNRATSSSSGSLIDSLKSLLKR
ncbi:MAG TPA: hypothetical protein VLJ39_10480 [Tepidisphaeraceae bacterium]|nr:hypothetical protein [Tepidisphaeraceae bacterium]